ncbi:hypothetical protein RI129_012707 [Pyrocoelia pectoralis]|uniref:Uncharacterized protein n=1 Tax=Pyrocoelia pectoralis TaxID=417401 RepID=A0AAN7UYR2_9COLE
MYKIGGKVGMVTGGASGIGALTARELLKAGLRGVTILDVNEDAGLKLVDKLNKEFGKGKAIFIYADVSVRKQFDDAFKKTIDVFGNLDILVNNAAVRREGDWEKHIAVNLTGTVNGTILAYDHYLPLYKSGDEAVILNISSIAGLYSYPAVPIYAATKSGIIGLTRSLGSDIHYKQTKIKVIAVCPGYTRTAGIIRNEDDFLGSTFFDIFKDSNKDAPVAQPPIAVSKGIVEIVKKGGGGSVWIVEGSKLPYEMDLPKNNEISSKVT